MEFTERSDDNLHVELDTKECELSDGQLQKMDEALHPLRAVIDRFPVSDLYITVIHHARSGDYHVKTSLLLTGNTLFTGDRDEAPNPAFERCIRKLVNKVDAYKTKLEKTPEKTKHVKGTAHEVVPDQQPDVEQMQKAIESADYAAFRDACFVYEDALRGRVGRWVQRYPEVDAQIGDEIHIDDIVEEVFLNAFEYFDRYPHQQRFGDWLESLIDPSVKVLLKNPVAELENISFARTLAR